MYNQMKSETPPPVIKTCAKCREIKECTPHFPLAPRNNDGWGSYCRECVYKTALESKFRNKVEWWHKDGFATEKEHFNYAIKQYATVLNCPQLLKHLK